MATLREDAIAIWWAGVAAVDSSRLVQANVVYRDGRLILAGEVYPLASSARLLVVGAGKASAGMAAGLEASLIGTPLAARLSGWVNVPADCVRPTQRIHLHAARPAGLNEPTEAGVEGTRRIMDLVRSLTTEDLCIVLLSGGGSALLPAPAEGVTLAEKQTVTRLLMSAGASIDELNTVRKQLSAVKGGRLAIAAGEARVVALIISDVIGDPLDVIASGPTVSDSNSPADGLAVLAKYDPDRTCVPTSVYRLFERVANPPARVGGNVRNVIIGNNATALNAAAACAAGLGYSIWSLGSDRRGIARDIGRELGALCRSVRDDTSASVPQCILSGGEPTVRLIETDQPRKGGRNQEVALAALDELWAEDLSRIAILSGGTDGEDGPTDAAGGIIDATVRQRARELNLVPKPFLAINNTYPFLKQTGGLLKTGPTHTNVMDLRVALIGNKSMLDERGGVSLCFRRVIVRKEETGGSRPPLA